MCLETTQRQKQIDDVGHTSCPFVCLLVLGRGVRWPLYSNGGSIKYCSNKRHLFGSVDGAKLWSYSLLENVAIPVSNTVMPKNLPSSQ